LVDSLIFPVFVPNQNYMNYEQPRANIRIIWIINPEPKEQKAVLNEMRVIYKQKTKMLLHQL